MYIQDVDSVFDIKWVDTVTYGDVNHQVEVEHSRYNFEEANTDSLFKMFNLFEDEASQLLEKQLVLPAYDYTLKCSHVFNLLDARGAISVSERTGYISRVRDLARKCARGYVNKREDLGFPLLKGSDSNE
jgi:glycyl-tRNA synthetase alpha chain